MNDCKMKIENSTILITGAAGGIGQALVQEFISRGAKRVYAADLETVLDNKAGWSKKVIPIALDVTLEDEVTSILERCSDVNILVNNAAIIDFSGFINSTELTKSRKLFEVNFWGYIILARAFAPILKKNGGGAIINILSEAARANAPFVAAYSASKAAAWSFTQALRAECRTQNTHVLAAFPSSTDTKMIEDLEGEKEIPMEIAKGILDGLESGLEDVSVGKHSIYFEKLMREDPKKGELEFAQFLPGDVSIPD